MNSKVSICMPTHEMNGKGAEYLEHSLGCIEAQTYSNIEVVISDQSTDDGIRNLCEAWKDKLDIKYHTFDGERKSTVNTNNALRLATGDILKPMFIDDFLFTRECIEQMVHALENNPDAGWVAVGFGHLFQESGNIGNFMIPRYHDAIHRGENTMSCPSVIAIKRTEELILLDEKVIWLMDCEWYKRLHNAFGPPIIIEQPSVIMRVHADSVSTSFNSKQDEKEKELQYVIEKIEGQEALN